MNQSSLKPVWICGVLILLLACVMAWLSLSFPYEREPGRPIVEVFWVGGISSAIALAGLLFGLRVQGNRKSLFGLILLLAIATRIVLVLSNPILEVDYYRYLWDGIAANNGVSPYKFSPEAVLHGSLNDPELNKLQAFINENPTARTIVARVHFEKYTTLYPPISQLVFSTTTALIPDGASVEAHIATLKFVLVLFDLGVILCLSWLLRALQKHPAWLIAYAWNPLVLKEIANGGHLDSIAIFFMTAGIAVFLSYARKIEPDRNGSEQSESDTQSSMAPVLSAALMACGVGAKLFPVIFMPAMCIFLWARKQRKASIAFAFSCLIVTGVVMWPMFNQDNKAVAVPIASQDDQQFDHEGLVVFLTKWRMNDAIFSGIYQNVEYDWGDYGPPWYVIVPNETRIKWSRDLSTFELAKGNGAYFVARLVTVSLFGMFYLCMLIRIWKTEAALDLAAHLFLIIGVFFYLQPTQNPWYWLWAMPLVCFAKNRGWLFVSAILFVYYLRFWFGEQEPSLSFLGRDYVGHDLFDHCITWLEFFAVIGVLAIAWIAKRLKTSATRHQFEEGSSSPNETLSRQLLRPGE